MSAQQIAHGERVMLGNLGRSNDGSGQLDQRVGELRIDRLTRLRRLVRIKLEEIAPIDGTRARYRTCSGTLREDAACGPLIQAIGRANLTVREAIGRIGELDWDEWPQVPPVVAKTVPQNIFDQPVACCERQELMQHDPLIMPAHQSLCLWEDIRDAFRAQVSY